jgi:small subunit ribosomal protein S13
MPRILNVQVPDHKRLEIGLTYIKGIGKARAIKICSFLGLNKNMKISELSRNQLSNIITHVQKKYKVGAKIDTDRIQRIRDLIKISSYRGLRHFKGLPVNGQRTSTNAKTVRRVNRKI